MASHVGLKAGIWLSVSKTSDQAARFVLQLLLARLLVPEEFGLIAIAAAIVNVLQVFVDGGLPAALVRLSAMRDEEAQSAFVINLISSLVLFGSLVLLRGVIAGFFGMPELAEVLPYIGFSLIFNAFEILPLVTLNRAMNFRGIFCYTFPATLVGGGLGIVLALQGGGVWSLVIANGFSAGVRALLVQRMGDFSPSLKGTVRCARGLVAYSKNLMTASFLHVAMREFPSFLVARTASEAALGYFNRAFALASFPQYLLGSITTQFTLPAYARKQEQPEELRAMVISSISLAAVVLLPMFGLLAGAAGPLVLLLLTAKWMPIIQMMQILCIAGPFVPIQSMIGNVLNVRSRPDLVLKVVATRQVLMALIVVTCSQISVTAVAVGVALHFVASHFVFMAVLSRQIRYPISSQIRDLLVPAIGACAACRSVELVATSLRAAPLYVQLAGGLIAGAAVYLGFGFFFLHDQMDQVWLLARVMIRNAQSQRRVGSQ
jgi:O-antigen/teichoic acid export membrane protein